VFLAALLLCCLHPACALASVHPAHFAHLSTQQGLSQNTIHDICQDKTGYIWFATMSGVDRYDGYGLVHIDGPELADGHGPVGPAFAICEWNGRLWAGWDADGIAWYDATSGSFRRPDLPQRLTAVASFYPDGDSLLWIGTGKGLDILSQKNGTLRWAPLRGSAGDRLGDKFISGIRRDAHRRVWIATFSGLFCLVPGEDTLRVIGAAGPREKRLSSNIIRAIHVDDGDKVWVCSDGGLDCYSESAGVEHVLSGNVITSVVQARSGDLWLGTWSAGVLVFDPVRRIIRQHISPAPETETGLPSGSIRSLAVDAFNGIWVGTADAGAHRFSEGGFQYRHHEIPAMSTGQNGAWAFCQPAALSEVWTYVGARNGLWAYTDGKEPRRVWASKYPVRAILEGRPEEGGGLWLGTLGGGVTHLRQDGPGFRRVAEYFASTSRSNEATVYALHRDRNGTMWVGTNGGGMRSLSGASPRGRVHALIDGSDTASWVMSITEDDVGTLWVGTWKHGIWHLTASGTRFEKVHLQESSQDPLRHASVFSVLADRHYPHVLWLGTNSDGLWRWDTRTEVLKQYSERDGLPDNTIYGIAQDRNGVIWFSTNRGLAAIDPAHGDIILPPGGEGALHGEFSLGAELEGRDGGVIFGGPGGFVVCERLTGVRAASPRVALSGISVGGKDLAVSPGVADPISVGPDSWPLTLTFTALHMDTPGQNSYAYAIEGFDTVWSAPSTNRRLHIRSLPPGSYTIRVRARTPGGSWTEAPLRVAVLATPAFRDTWRFQALLAGSVIILFVLAGFAWWRRTTVLQEERVRLRKKIARDFHDDFGARAARISMTAHLLKDETHVSTGDVSHQLEHLALDAQKLSREMRGMTWELDPEKDSLMDLASYLKEYSDELFDDSLVAFSLEGVDRAFERVVLPMEWRQQIGRIFKEAMTNTLKHADGCRHVTLGFTVERGIIRIELRDDGNGFGVVGTGHGNGLKNMRERARSVHGEITIDSYPGAGTSVVFQGKLPR
jgi:signal transduction histidine kinase/ligand-binding sensor domain-containing protein